MGQPITRAAIAMGKSAMNVAPSLLLAHHPNAVSKDKQGILISIQ